MSGLPKFNTEIQIYRGSKHKVTSELEVERESSGPKPIALPIKPRILSTFLLWLPVLGGYKNVEDWLFHWKRHHTLI